MNRTMRLAAAALAAAVAACGGDDGGDALEPTYANVQREVFNKHCIACHTAKATADGGLSLTPGLAHADLVDQPVESPLWPAARQGGSRVVPGDPAASLLMATLDHAADLPSELRMPQGQQLSADKVELVRRWIEAGAPAK